MTEQSVHEQALFKAFLKWLLEEKGLLLQSDCYLHILHEHAFEEVKDAYMRAIEDVVRDYCNPARSYPNQPVWCARHRMQTCHRCDATGCGDNDNARGGT